MPAISNGNLARSKAGKLLDTTLSRTPYSARNASTGEMRLVRSAGTREATNADNPSVATAIDITEGLNGFSP